MKERVGRARRGGYNFLRAIYLGLPLSFEKKKGIKDVFYTAISFVWEDASFLDQWKAQRQFNQIIRSAAIPGGHVYGGENEIYLYSIRDEWLDLLSLSADRTRNWLLPMMKKMVKATHLAKPVKPLVSVIIPSFGAANYTLACVYSLLKQETGHCFDIHIADDNPDDPLLCGYVARLGAPNIHYYCNQKNLGFTLNANQAAERAGGQIIVFLNNDCYLHPEWLERLIKTYFDLNSTTKVGVVGSKILHRSLAIQESGCLLQSGGVPQPLGRGAHAFDPQFSYLREVDFVSACSMLVDRNLFLDMGGFDPRFSPGYYEDPEFCERLKVRGRHNYVQPASVVIHEEGASFGKDGFAQVKEQKRDLFNQLHPIVHSVDVRHRSRPILLCIDAYLPMPDKGSGSVDAMAFLDYYLDAGYRLVFYAHHHNNYFSHYSAELESLGVEVLQDNFQSLTSFLDAFGSQVAVVMISRFYQMDHFLPVVQGKAPQARLIYNTVDLHFLREEREAAITGGDTHFASHLEAIKKKELDYICSADASIVISAYEKNLLATMLPEVQSIYHVPQCREFLGTREPFEKRSGFVFIGSAHQPNVDAIRYFHEAIHPLLVRMLPSYRLAVIGQELHQALSPEEDRELLENPHISFLGYIEDVAPVFDRALAMVVPLRYGSGIKGKVIQSIQHALPCVATAIGTEGLELPNDASVLQADTPQLFAEALAALTRDQGLWEHMSTSAEAVFQQRFSSAVFRSRMNRLMAHLQLASPGPSAQALDQVADQAQGTGGLPAG